MAFGSSATFCSVECTLMDGSNAYTLPHLYSDTQQLRLLRDLLVFEEIERSVDLRGNLSIAWGVPQHWIHDANITLSSAGTVFGAVSLSIGASSASRVLAASVTVGAAARFDSGDNNALQFIKLRLRALPDWGTIGSVTVNGEPFSDVVGGDLLEIGGENFVLGQTVGIVAHFNAAL
eukprot:COSAG02_NODE_876_length_16272_cov_138.802510_11_plen_177_part_00